MIFYTVGFNLACFFVTLFQCSLVYHKPSSCQPYANNRHRPASTYWEIFTYMGKAKCLNIKTIYYFHAGQNTFGDFVIFLWVSAACHYKPPSNNTNSQRKIY
jgi:hypothetical protein